MTREVVVHPDPAVLAAAVADRLVTAIIDAQAQYGEAGIVLTGGGLGGMSQQAVLANPAAAAIAWDRVDFYWGDERFVPGSDPDRNEGQARSALLDHVPCDPARVHAMPASDGAFGNDPDAAAAGHWRVLAAVAARQRRSTPRFDVLMLGVGPDAHIASLFPGFPEVLDATVGVLPVRDSPKPPPIRLSFTRPLINTAEQVWLVAGGAEKAAAFAAALAPGAELSRYPASGVTGRNRTLALIDEAAASQLPPSARH